jgi:aerobic carbon-monoxide dehydrogenase small subunit
VSKRVQVEAVVNGKPTDFLCEPRQSLLEVLRDELRLTGAKEGCNNGNCGACNVILDGRLVNSCVVLGVEVEGKAITTIEGLAGPGGLDHNPRPTEQQVRHYLAGNLCRCTGYDKIVRAVLDAAGVPAPTT